MKKTKRKKRAALLCLSIGLALILAALALILYNRWDANRAYEASEEVAAQLVEEIPVGGEQNRGQDPEWNPYREPEAIEVDGNGYIGILEIPSINLVLPVMDQWDYTRLKIAACRYTGSYLTNDMVIAGHNYLRHFSPIKRLKPGSDVYFTSVAGRVFHYQVVSLETLKPTQIEDMITGDWDLNMFTCNPGGQTRMAVRCAAVS